MQIQELRLLARQAFGEKLEHATPANVREFLDALHQREWKDGQHERAARSGDGATLDLDSCSRLEGLSTWESHVRGFFNRSLDARSEESAAMLWLFALEMAYSGIEDLDAEALDRLFTTE